MNKKNRKEEQTNCPGYYQVSGYTTKDGKEVNDYTRQCWKHGNGVLSNSISASGISRNEVENPPENKNEDNYPNPMPEQKQTPPTYPTDENPPEEKSKKDKIKEELQNIIKIMIDNLDKTQYFDNSLSPYTPIPNTFSGYTFGNNNNNNQPFSTFDSKSTKEKIQESTKNVEEILKQKQINDNDINNIEAKTRQSISSIFDDIEDLSVKKSNQPEIPAIGLTEQGQNIETARKQARDDASNAIIMLNLAKNALDKQWKHVNKRDENFDEKFDAYTNKKAELDKLSKGVFDLFYAISSIDKNTPEKVKKIRDEIGLMRFRPMLPKKQAEQQQKWIWPCKGEISSGYGWRVHPITQEKTFHTGIDIKVKAGTPVRAIADGKVSAARSGMTGYGTGVFIDHGKVNGKYVRSEYGHLSRYCVKYGQYVKQGEIIGYSGNTGWSTGEHLHLTIRISIDNIHFEHKDPLKYLPKY